MKILFPWTLVLCCIFLLGAEIPASAQATLKMSTTTSTENSGLLNVLLPPFEKAENVKIQVISVGTGKALKLGETGDVDIVFVHSRAAEDKFVKDGFGVDRKDVMYNDFVIVGPKEDPAKLKEAKTTIEAFKRLADAQAEFISRGDDSGTHKQEKAIWNKAGIKPQGKWYVEAGQGMGAVLQMAAQKNAYCLTDRGTFITLQSKLPSMIVFEGDKDLFNPYGIIAVNPAKHPKTNYALAKQFIDFVTGDEGQNIIKNFRTNDQQLFFPSAGK